MASCPLKDAGYPSAICQTAASFFISPHRPIKTTSGTGNELESTDSYPPSATNESTKFVSAGSGSVICTGPPADSHCVCVWKTNVLKTLKLIISSLSLMHSAGSQQTITRPVTFSIDSLFTNHSEIHFNVLVTSRGEINDISDFTSRIQQHLFWEKK